jgi:hypothetical protein
LSDKWIALADAVNLIAARLKTEEVDGLTDRRNEERKRTSLAAGKLYEALRRGYVRSRAGRVFAEDQREDNISQGRSPWALANWPIPASLWQVTTVYRFDRSFTVTSVWPANEAAPPGWPKSEPVRLTDIEVMLDDIQRRWPELKLPKTVALETRAIKALAEQLGANPEMTRAEAAKWCDKSGYKLGRRPFERVWPDARERAGLPRMGLPGRKRKLTT